MGMVLPPTSVGQAGNISLPRAITTDNFTPIAVSALQSGDENWVDCTTDQPPLPEKNGSAMPRKVAVPLADLAVYLKFAQPLANFRRKWVVREFP